MTKKVIISSNHVRPEGYEYPAGLNSRQFVSDTRSNVGQSMATAAPSGLVSPTSPEGKQDYFGPADPGPGQKVKHTFAQSGSFTCGFTGNVDVIIVGGGGSGGGGFGGGGGGGGVIWASEVTVHSGQTYPIIIGAGGTYAPGSMANPVKGGVGGNTEIVFYDGAHPMCNSTGHLVAYGGGGGGAKDRAGGNGNPNAQTGEGNAGSPTGASPADLCGSGGGGGGGAPTEEGLGLIGRQDPNYAGYYPVDGGQNAPDPAPVIAVIANNPATSPVSGPPVNPTGNRISYFPLYPYGGMTPSMPGTTYTNGGAYGGGANNHFGMPGGQGATGYLRDTNLPSGWSPNFPAPNGPITNGAGGGGAFGQGIGYGYNPTSPGTGSPSWGNGGTSFSATVKGVVPLGGLGGGGGGGGNGPNKGGSAGAGDGASSGYKPIPAPLAPYFPPGAPSYLSATSGAAAQGGGGGGGGNPAPYSPAPWFEGPIVPGSGGSGGVYIIYDAIQGELANGAVFSIN